MSADAFATITIPVIRSYSGITAGKQKKDSDRFLQFENFFSDLLYRLVLEIFLPLFRIIATAGIKTPDKPYRILRSKRSDKGIVPFALDLSDRFTLHAGSSPSASAADYLHV